MVLIMTVMVKLMKVSLKRAVIHVVWVRVSVSQVIGQSVAYLILQKRHVIMWMMTVMGALMNRSVVSVNQRAVWVKRRVRMVTGLAVRLLR
jgi:hypothetical protein